MGRTGQLEPAPLSSSGVSAHGGGRAQRVAENCGELIVSVSPIHATVPNLDLGRKWLVLMEAAVDHFVLC